MRTYRNNYDLWSPGAWRQGDAPAPGAWVRVECEDPADNVTGVVTSIDRYAGGTIGVHSADGITYRRAVGDAARGPVVRVVEVDPPAEIVRAAMLAAVSASAYAESELTRGQVYRETADDPRAGRKARDRAREDAENDAAKARKAGGEFVKALKAQAE